MDGMRFVLQRSKKNGERLKNGDYYEIVKSIKVNNGEDIIETCMREVNIDKNKPYSKEQVDETICVTDGVKFIRRNIKTTYNRDVFDYRVIMIGDVEM